MKYLRQPKLVLLTVFSFLTVALFAQEVTITGTVTNKETAEPLEGVSVKVKNTTTGTTTGKDGSFTIKAPSSESILSFSFVGFTVFEIKAGNGGLVLTIPLSKTDTNLDEVVVVGYSTQKRNRITGAISVVKASDIQDIPAPNIAGALRGRVAGLSVSQASGKPGAGITLNVRNSATSETARLLGVTDEPLYVVDGITVTKDAFDNLDPSMVEDITILKDASAAIYGAAGAKGVVLITTKRGKIGKPRLSYSGYFGISDATRKPEMMTAFEHATLLNDAYRISNAPLSNFFTTEQLNYLKTLNYKSWFDQIWQPAHMQRHNLNFSGGSDKITFFAGGAFQNENGNYAGIKNDKYSFRTGVVANIAKGFKADINFNVDYRHRYSKNPTSENDQAFIEAMVQVPMWVPSQINGKYVNIGGSNPNPLAAIESGYYSSNKSSGYRINSALSYDFSGVLKGLVARLQVSQATNNGSSTTYRPPYSLSDFKRFGPGNALYYDTLLTTSIINGGNNSTYEPSMSKSNSYQGFFTLQYNKAIANHGVSVLLGGEQSETNTESVGVRWLNQVLPGLDDYWAFDQSGVTPSRSVGNGVKRSFFGRLNYNYDGKYTVDAVTRFDASSNFATGKIWGVFPSVGVGWVVSRENFFRKNIAFINYLKLRFSYGVVGDDRVAERLWQERYRVDVSGYLYNNTLQGGLNPERIPNPNITWEKKRAINGGIELSMLRDKLTLGVDFFQNFSYDAFDKGADQAFPMYAGFSAPVLNYMERYNWGSEFTIGYRENLTKDIRFNASMNFGFGNSVVSKILYNPFQLFETSPPDWQVQFGVDPRKYNTGNWGLKSLGMFRTQDQLDAFLGKNPGYLINNKVPQVGWLYFEDTNGDGVITDRDMVPMFKRTDAKFATSLQLAVSYKSLTLRANLVGRFGGKVLYDSKSREIASLTSNAPTFWSDRWTPENPNGKFPRFDDESIARGWESDFWAVDGTMIRVNDMTLSYTLPKPVLDRIGMSDVRVLVTGNNLWVLKNPLKYKDPYSSYIFDYPTIRTISVGLSLGL